MADRHSHGQTGDCEAAVNGDTYHRLSKITAEARSHIDEMLLNAADNDPQDALIELAQVELRLNDLRELLQAETVR